ncbi:MAG TPA: redoxin domain-containing protein [Blastocatellia bacterium]|nr:redoxin domain-containing protein [Blastocatellia bacterium]
MTAKEKLWTPGRIIATVAVAALIATIGYTVFSGGGEVKTESNLALPGTPVAESGDCVVPPDYTVPTIDGRAIKLSDYRGKVVVLDFWATWCPPCREEIPQLVRLAKQNRERGLEIIGMHIDDRGRSSPQAIRDFMARYGINYTVGLATDEMFVSYLGEKETAIPQTIIFDRNGQLAAHFIGYTAAEAVELEKAINRALAGS